MNTLKSNWPNWGEALDAYLRGEIFITELQAAGRAVRDSIREKGFCPPPTNIPRLDPIKRREVYA